MTNEVKKERANIALADFVRAYMANYNEGIEAVAEATSKFTSNGEPMDLDSIRAKVSGLRNHETDPLPLPVFPRTGGGGRTVDRNAALALFAELQGIDSEAAKAQQIALAAKNEQRRLKAAAMATETEGNAS